MITQALILAAGYGKRMLPITNDIPKPLVKVWDKSLLERILDDLISYGIKKIIINTHHKAEKINFFIRQYLKNHQVEIILIYEEEILETGGAIINILDKITAEDFFVINGDILIPNHKDDPNIYQLLNSRWNPEKMDGLLLLQELSTAIGYDGDGDFSLSNNNEIIYSSKFDNKLPYVFAGIHITKPKHFIAQKKQFLKIMDLYKNMQFRKFFGYVNPYDWLHIGTPASIVVAENFIKNFQEN